jgi:hypothetical protein
MAPTLVWVARWDAREWHLASALKTVPGSKSANGKAFQMAYTPCGIILQPVIPRYRASPPEDGRPACLICQAKADYLTITEGAS